jgi:hypothetical protein
MTDKWGRRLFKTGGAFLLLLAAVHSISLFQKQTPANETERQLLDLMSNYKFNLMGSVRSMWDLLQGFSVAFALSALGLGSIDLALSNERTALLKRLALLNTLWLAAMIAVSLHYFFVFPTSFLAAALLLFLSAWLKLPADATN